VFGTRTTVEASPFTTLFARAARHLERNGGPRGRAVLRDKRTHQHVLVVGPATTRINVVATTTNTTTTTTVTTATATAVESKTFIKKKTHR